MKNKIKLVAIVMVIMLVLGLIDVNNETKMLSSEKIKMLNEEIENNKISIKEKDLLKLIKETEKDSEEIEKINNQIKELDLNKIEKEFMEKCGKSQIQRILDKKEVEKGYCEKKLEENVVEVDNIVVVEVKEEIKGKLIPLELLNITRANLNTCKEIKLQYGFKVDEIRCASMISLVGFLETQHGKTGIGPTHKNNYGIKNPTDKTGLLGNWEKMSNNNIKFETHEMGTKAFAYYYMRYHNHRSFDNFVDRYVAWDNQQYKASLKTNYNRVYLEYK